MTGVKKCKIFVIIKSANIGALKTCKSLPVIYAAINVIRYEYGDRFIRNVLNLF